MASMVNILDKATGKLLTLANSQFSGNSNGGVNFVRACLKAENASTKSTKLIS